MGRFVSLARIGSAILLVSVAATASALADEPVTKSVDPSLEYIKNVRQEESSSGVLEGKHRRLGSTEPRRPDGVVVPEPGTIALVAMGLAGLKFARRKKA